MHGLVDVRDCAVGTWVIAPGAVHTGDDAWMVTGFIYRRIETSAGRWDTNARTAWLDAAEDVTSPGPYRQMASFLREEGHPTHARKVLIAGNHRLEHGLVGIARMILFGWTIGYGYRPRRALAFLVPLFLALAMFVAAAPTDADEPAETWMVTSAASDDVTAANDCDGQGPCLQPVVFALDTILPIINFGQADQWTVSRAAGWAWALAVLVWFSIAAGWFFGILLAAAAGGLVRQV